MAKFYDGWLFEMLPQSHDALKARAWILATVEELEFWCSTTRCVFAMDGVCH